MAIAGAAALVMGLGACGIAGNDNDPQSVVDHFAGLLDKKDAAGAAQLTSYPNGAEDTLKQMFGSLNGGKPDYRVVQYIPLDKSTANFNMKATWNFGPGKEWDYDLHGTVRKLAIGWRISWDPTVVIPQLDASRTVKLVRTEATPSPKVNDSSGALLMSEQTINAIKVDPAQTTDLVGTTNRLADVISVVAPLITGPSLMQQLSTSQGKPVDAVRLRADDFAVLESKLTSIPGVVVDKQPTLITSDRRIWSPLLDAYKKVWQENRDAHAGWGIQVFGPDGAMVTQLAGQQGPPGPDIAGTLDNKLQRAAEDAVVSVGTAASIVAIQPSTGAIVAAAQNNQASEQGNPAFTNAYPVGGMSELFKAVEAQEKGKQPQEITAVSDVAQGAAQLGVGIGFKVDGLDETTGHLPIGGRGVEAVHQGSTDPITASPLGMAIAAATIARGSVAPPMIEIGRPGTTDADLKPLDPAVVDRLRRLLTDGVGSDELTTVRHYAGVIAYDGIAGSAGWLIANMGDLAFAIHIDDVDSGDATARMAARLLRSLATPDQ
ncbi:NTF2-like N-terminal transpeptidase domain-containing protein [Nocardia stercoris]|nr:NTF2-like N-terminal transpeptidase domain-containing protein [Nocardia stercoris]